MIFVTGDTHGMTDYRKLELFAQSNPALTKADYVIIAGDCGIVWSRDTLDAPEFRHTKICLSRYCSWTEIMKISIC